MTKMIITSTDGWKIEYALDSIKEVKFGKLSQLHSKSDIVGNGLRPGDATILIVFNDGTQATFADSKKEVITYA